MTRHGALHAFEVARRWFLEGRRVDMLELAAELDVSRATLFRWVGNRDLLLGEILWSMAEPVFDRKYWTTRLEGADLVAQLVFDYVRTVNADEAFHRFLREEPDRALRVLTTKASVVQRRTVTKLAEVINGEVDRGVLVPPLPVADLAYLIVRIGESFLYIDVIAGGEPDPEKARQAVAALLSTTPHPDGSDSQAS